LENIAQGFAHFLIGFKHGDVLKNRRARDINDFNLAVRLQG